MSKLLSSEQLDRLSAGLYSVGLGYDTQDLPKRYSKDVKALLDERDELVKLLQQATARADSLQARIVIGQQYLDDLWGTVCPDAGPGDRISLVEKIKKLVADHIDMDEPAGLSRGVSTRTTLTNEVLKQPTKKVGS